MASSSMLFFAFLAISPFSSKQGWAATCGPSSINITQAETGRAFFEFDFEYEVTVTNTCSCPQSNVVVSCAGFGSAVAVDPRKFKTLDSDHCLINNGQAIQPSSSFNFTYAWHAPVDLLPSSSSSNC